MLDTTNKERQLKTDKWSEKENPGEEKSLDDDSFLDWETRDESFPLYKHIISGKII